MEYAVCIWTFHLEAALSDAVNTNKTLVGEVAEMLDSILDLHWNTAATSVRVPRTTQDNLASLKDQKNYDLFCQAIYTWKKGLRPSVTEISADLPLQLLRWVEHVRERIKALAKMNPGLIKTESCLFMHYGRNLFKCPRPSCYFFHEGFGTPEQQQQHINKHERSHMCLEDGCPYSILGFATEKELEKHGIQEHGHESAVYQVTHIELSPENEPIMKRRPVERIGGPRTPRPTSPRVKPPRKKVNTTCHLCQRTYTRTYNLHSHMRYHNNERPYSCGACDRSFTRKSDMERHQSQHNSGKQHQCWGTLLSGNIWGCQNTFGRADALSEHFRTNAGYACIEPAIRDRFPNENPDCRAMTLDRWRYVRRELTGMGPTTNLEQDWSDDHDAIRCM